MLLLSEHVHPRFTMKKYHFFGREIFFSNGVCYSISRSKVIFGYYLRSKPEAIINNDRLLLQIAFFTSSYPQMFLPRTASNLLLNIATQPTIILIDNCRKREKRFCFKSVHKNTSNHLNSF